MDGLRFAVAACGVLLCRKPAKTGNRNALLSFDVLFVGNTHDFDYGVLSRIVLYYSNVLECTASTEVLVFRHSFLFLQHIPGRLR